MIWLFGNVDYGRAVATVGKIVPDDGNRNFVGYAKVYDNQSPTGTIDDYVVTGGLIKPRISITNLSPTNYYGYYTIPVYVSATGYPFKLYYTATSSGYFTITGPGTYYIDCLEGESVRIYSDPEVTWFVEKWGYADYYSSD